MFFNSANITADISSILHLSWGNRDDRSGVRPYSALSFRCAGNSEFTHQNGSTTAKSGDIVFVPAFYEFHQFTQGYEDLFVVHFTSGDTLPPSIKKITPSDPDYFERKFRDMYDAWLKKQIGYEYCCKSILYKILMKIEADYAETKPQQIINKIDEAVEYIHDNYFSENITIDNLSKMCGMSDTYFRRLFYKRFSVTPLKYINDLKLSHATELLSSGYYTVSEVSVKCGFENVYYFSSFVKQHTGFSPSHYLPD